MKEPSLETQLHQAKEEGEKLKQQAENRGNPAFTPPDALPLTQEKEPNKFDMLAFQLEEFLKKPLVYNEVVVAESTEKVFEGEAGKKRLEALEKEMVWRASSLERNNGGGAQDILITHTALPTLSEEVQKIFHKAFQVHSGGKTLEDVIPAALSALARKMVRDAQHAMRNSGGRVGWQFLVAYAVLPPLSEDAREIFRKEFRAHSGGKTLEDVLNNVLPALAEETAEDARKVSEENHRPSALRLLTLLTSLKTLIPHYHKLAEKERAKEETRTTHTTNKKTTEPIIPPKNF